MGLSKQAIDGGLDLPLGQGIDLEAELARRALATEDARTGVESFLRQGPGKAKFAGR
jgi:enoyl-CoA hydratase